MAYVHGFSKESISQNIETFQREYRYTHEEAIAASLEVARRAYRKAHPEGPYPEHLRGVRKPSRRRKKGPRRERVVIVSGEQKLRDGLWHHWTETLTTSWTSAELKRGYRNAARRAGIELRRVKVREQR